MLDWQKDAAKDPQARSTQKAGNLLSVLFAVQIAGIFVIGASQDVISSYWRFTYIPVGVLSCVMTVRFKKSSTALLLAILSQTAVLIMFSSIALISLPNHIAMAAFNGFFAAISIFTMVFITSRIMKNRAIQI